MVVAFAEMHFANGRTVYDYVMQLQDILYSQGFGTRRICAGLVQQGYVQVDLGEGLVTCDDALEEIEVHEGLSYSCLLYTSPSPRD
jgi:hypothetical protein